METSENRLVVVGAGQAGAELALAARQGGWAGPIVLLGDEPVPPYQRPPLSKGYLLGEVDAAALALRAPSAFEAAGIVWRPGARVAALDRPARAVTLASGERLGYAQLAWCAGGRPRPWTCPGLAAAPRAPNLHYLRTAADAEALRGALRPGVRLAVVGAGYVGLEVAASARKQGAEVTVIEAQPRVLARVAGPQVSAFYEALHRQHGVRVLTGTAVEQARCDDGGGGEGRIVALRCSGGVGLEVDAVLAGIGMLPNVEVLQAAGLATDAGVPVDAQCRTADPLIVAAGDCTVQHHPLYGRALRLESVPNALEQARAAAATLCGKATPARAVPWFWSDQYGLKLQSAGLAEGHDRCVLRGDPDSRSFMAFYLRGRQLLAVDAIQRPADFMLVRRLLAQPLAVEADPLGDASIPLKELLAPVAA